MNLPAFLFLCVTALCISSCRTISGGCGKLDDMNREYLELLRWNEMEKAGSIFVGKDYSAAFEKKAATLKELKIADYQIRSSICDREKGEATILVVYDYYRPPSARLVTQEEKQLWRYIETVEENGWKLVSPLPEFD